MKAEYLNQYGLPMQPTGTPVWEPGDGAGSGWFGGGTVTLTDAGLATYTQYSEWFYVNVAVGSVECRNHRISVSSEKPYVDKLTLTVDPSSRLVKPFLADGTPQSESFEVRPYARDQYGEEFRDFTGANKLHWSIVDTPDQAITITGKTDPAQDPSATLRVFSTTPAGNVTVKAATESAADGQPVVVATGVAKVEREEPN